MIRIVDIVSSVIKQGITVVKVACYGKSDIHTLKNCTPYGIDTCPVDKSKGVMAKTENVADKILIGIVNKDNKALPGQIRLYEKDGFEVWLRNGKIEIGGNENFAVKYNELKAELDKTNDLLTGIINILNGDPIPEPGNGSPSALQTSLKGAITGKELGDYSQAKNDKILM